MSELKVTPEGMPAIYVGETRYPLFFSVYGLQRWAEHCGVDYQGALEAGWTPLPENLSKLLEIALSGGEKRRVVFDGGGPREINQELITQILDLYHPRELAPILAEAWELLPDDEEKETEDPSLPPED